jgi:NADH:ubiquinone oxidoreductase subunit E
MARPVIEICLGSSCFARGGSRYPAAAAAWLAAHRAEADLRGRRCHRACAEGPMVAIDGVEHRVGDVTELQRLLATVFAVHV